MAISGFAMGKCECMMVIWGYMWMHDARMYGG